MNTTLLTTKLRMPPLRSDIVHRAQLVSSVNSKLNSRFVLVSAPAGYGKTTLLVEFLTEYKYQAAWLTLDSGDNDPVRFFTYLISSVQNVAPQIGKAAIDLFRSAQLQLSGVEPILIDLLNELSSLQDNLYIILDDYHVIENSAIHSALVFMIEHLPPTVHLVLATRISPPMPLARWRLRGQMEEINVSDLEFTHEEATALFTKVIKISLSSDDISALKSRTEGWIAGLQMAALSLRDRKDASRFIQTFSGTQRYIMDYMLEEVLSVQQENMQEFLLQTSILEHLNGPVCEYITGHKNAQNILQELEKSNMFIIPLDDRREWYRYHNLFTDLLRSHLKRTQPETMVTLHHKAAEWYERNGMVDDAVHHMLVLGDYEHLVHLVEQNALSVLSRGEIETVQRWIRLIPYELVLNHPFLCILQAWIFVLSGQADNVEPLLAHAEMGIGASIPPGVARDMRGTIAATRAFTALAAGNMASAVCHALMADELLGKENYGMRVSIQFVLGSQHWLDGDIVKAEEAFTRMSELGRKVNSIWTISDANSELGVCLKIAGKLRQAAQLYRETMELAFEKDAHRFGMIAKIDVGLSDVLREWNDLESAQKLITDAIDRMKWWKVPSNLVIAYIYLGRILRTQGDLEGAYEVLQEAEQLKQRLAVFAPLPAMIEAERVKLWLKQGNLIAAESWAQKNYPSEGSTSNEQKFKLIAVSRVLIALGKTKEAVDLLIRLACDAEQRGRTGELIEIMVLQALALRAENDVSNATDVLEKCLMLAEPEGYVRVFVDESAPMVELLLAIRKRQLAGKGVTSINKRYINRILEAFTVLELGKDTLKKDAPTAYRLLEPLSSRELEVLRLIANGLTNKEISEKLFVTIGTVKAHTANIFRKLDVNNRTQAAALARDLQLL